MSDASAGSAPSAPLAQSARMDLAGLDECLSRLGVFFDAYARSIGAKRKWTAGYHAEIQRLCRYYIPENASVLEVGCGTGDLLAALRPARGMGIDLSEEMVRIAAERYPEYSFKQAALERFSPAECAAPFDYIVISDTLAFVYDILAFFNALKPFCHPRTRIVMNMHSRLWQPVLSLAERMKLKHRQPVLNWVTVEDTRNLLNLAGFEAISTDSRILMPAKIPVLARLLNSALAPFFPFRQLCLTNWIVARLPLEPVPACAERPSVSVVVPCRNEAGNIPQVLARLPKLGAKTELILVEGHSKDGTLEACQKLKAENPDFDISVYEQTGKGKKDAVWLGFEKAKGDILMILDADLTVQPEDLPAFYNAIVSGRVEFVNGCRLVYPMEGQAMRFLNLVANKFFSLAFSSLIGQNVKDTLCGTKVLLRSDYDRLKAGRAHFGDFDPFGDFDLLFGSAKLSLKIADMPVRYRARVYGETQISRFRHGWMLLKMCGVGLIRLRMR